MIEKSAQVGALAFATTLLVLILLLAIYGMFGWAGLTGVGIAACIGFTAFCIDYYTGKRKDRGED